MSRAAAWAVGATTIALAACRVIDNTAAVYGGPPIPLDAGWNDAGAKAAEGGGDDARMIGPPER